MVTLASHDTHSCTAVSVHAVIVVLSSSIWGHPSWLYGFLQCLLVVMGLMVEEMLSLGFRVS